MGPGRKRAAAVLGLVWAWALAGVAAGCGDGPPAAAPGPDGSAVPPPRRVVVATEAAYPPFELVDEKGVIVGFDIDLVRAVCREAGLEAEFVNQPFDGILPGLQQGRFDAAVSAITITAERAAVVAFTDGYYDAGQTIGVRPDDERMRAVAGPADLAGRTLTVQLGTTGEIEARKIPGVTVRTFDAIDPAVLDVVQKRADAVIADDPTLRDYAAKRGGIRLAGAPFTEEKYGIAVRKDRADLVAALNDGLRRVRASGEYDRIRERWIGGK